MKNHLRHEVRVIDITCSPTGCRLGIFFLTLALWCVFNFWWFLSDPQLVHGIPSPELTRVAEAFCKSRSLGNESCDIFNGKWVPDPSPPPYTNATCPYIFPNQNCMTNGRPDTGFLHWQWQPHDCDIPSFNPALFLRLMMGKSMLFVGDSLARNQMQSLLCLLSQVETPRHDEGTESDQWSFSSHNFKLALEWSPFLVNYTVNGDTWKIHLDRPDEGWTSPLPKYDITVFDTLDWFFRQSIYYVQGESVSEYNSATSIHVMLESMRHVWSTVWKYVVENYNGVAVLRTGSVSHFEGKAWNEGGYCNRTEPYSDPHRNMSLTWADNEILKIQKEEFRRAVERAENNKSAGRIRLLEVTYSTLLRPDGHPGSYRVQLPAEPRNDCAHWCMPGPIDSWNYLLFADPQIMCSS